MSGRLQSERLREKLTERGVDWLDESNGYADVTTFIANGIKWTVISKSYLNPEHDWMTLRAEHITPEQAIAATLGNDPYDAVSCEHVISPDTLHLILDEWDVHPGWTATNENMAQLLGQAAATLGGGECKVVASSTDGLTTDNPKQWFELSCGHTFMLYGLGVPVACPVCGKAVKR